MAPAETVVSWPASPPPETPTTTDGASYRNGVETAPLDDLASSAQHFRGTQRLLCITW